jgi:hypothetical protein
VNKELKKISEINKNNKIKDDFINLKVKIIIKRLIKEKKLAGVLKREK